MSDYLDIYTVSFFGHRYIDNLSAIEDKLESVIERLIRTKEYVEFLVGRNGDFDRIVASVVRRVKQRLEYGNCALILVLPYITAEYEKNEEYFHQYYDDVEVCYESSCSHYKAAMTWDATFNALAGRLRGNMGMVGTFDELSRCREKDLSSLVYRCRIHNV